MKYLYSLFILLSIAAVFLAPLDKHELNEISFTFAMGVDYAEDGYELSLQLINPAAIAGKTPVPISPYVVYKATGKTIDTALERISVNLSRFVHLKQVEVIILSEKLAREGKTKDVAEYVMHSAQVPIDANMVIIKDVDASELLKVYSPIEGFSAFEISNILDKLGRDIPRTATEIKVDEIKEGKDIALPFISLAGDLKSGQTKGNLETTSPAHVAYGGLALFKEDQLATFLDYRDAAYLSMLQGVESGFSVVADCPKGENAVFTFRVLGNKAREGKVEIYEDKYIYHFDLKLKGDISQFECEVNLDNPEEIKLLEKQLKKTIQKNVDHLLTIAQEHELDPLGLGLIMREESPEHWKKVKSDWPSELKNADIQLSTKITVQNIGKYKAGDG
ncbi:Ger(x)C family spore germination protein [Bacillus sp. ISL-37]|jgi:spore germination protein KC|uniref:Ger(x)C family spore germination protein n=1 Tax=Bacillus sp. ISL-37 TaxID=2819123 RepID=UPI001BE9AFD8|nr:Ger(x)C family spore germination protein [Bacillus sp. ISL-37]MBT2684706.1 Ger(x)C family spore germination protein [Bacillus sp. ISL-37]